MQVFIDGSELKPKDRRQSSTHRVHSWGVIINHTDRSYEFHGSRMDTIKLKGQHERIALIEAIIQIRNMGEDPTAAVYYTDHDMVPYIADFHHAQNYKRSAMERETATMKMVCHQCYDESIFELVMQCVLIARFVQIKGHRRHVYHSRCDYLAKYANRIFRNIEMHFEQFEQWLQSGFIQYDATGEAYRWYPPFSNPVQQE